MKQRTLALAGLIGVAALLRILPHPWNFSPIAAMALFSGAHVRSRAAAWAAPLAALFAGDLILGFYPSMWVTYVCFSLIVWVGRSLSGRPQMSRVLATALGSSILFFIVSNFGVWLLDHMYVHNGPGLWACYASALPFFQGTFLGDLSYTALLFGAFRFAEMRFPSLQQASSF